MNRRDVIKEVKEPEIKKISGVNLENLVDRIEEHYIKIEIGERKNQSKEELENIQKEFIIEAEETDEINSIYKYLERLINTEREIKKYEEKKIETLKKKGKAMIEYEKLRKETMFWWEEEMIEKMIKHRIEEIERDMKFMKKHLEEIKYKKYQELMEKKMEKYSKIFYEIGKELL